MARSLPVMLAILVACGGKDPDPTTTPPTGTGTTTDTSTTTFGGTPSGTTGGTPTGTTTTTPPVDFCPAWPAATGTIVTAMPTDDLQAAIDGLSTGDTLELQTGTYALTTTLQITTDGITVRSQSGNRADVTLDGTNLATHIFDIRASDVSLVSMTLTNAYENGVNVVPSGADISGTQLYDLSVVDNAQYGVYIGADGLTFHADSGTIACSHIELTATGRANTRNACRTAGIEAERAQGWTVTDTTARGFWCDIGSAHAAIRFWRGSRDTLIQRSRADNSRRGIVLGVGNDLVARSYADAPCGGIVAQHYGGMIVNSLAWAADSNLEGSTSGILDGISLESACEVQVLHNTVNVGELAVEGDLIHRYDKTTGEIRNNLVHKTVLRLDGSLASTGSNTENVPDAEWVSVPNGDMHLAPAATSAIDAADPAITATVPDDIDGQSRGSDPDAGWDERRP